MEKTLSKAVIRVFWKHVLVYKRAFFLLAISVIILPTLNVIVPLYYKQFFDALAVGINSRESAYLELLHTLIVIVGLHLLSWALHRVGGFSSIYLESRVMTDLVQNSFRHLIRHSYQFFSDNFTGSLVRKVNRLARAFEEITDQVQFKLLPLSVTMVGILIVLFHRNFTLGLVLSLWVFVFVTLHYFIAVWKLKYDTQKSKKDSEATGVLADALTNNINIKLFSGYEHENGLFKKVTEELWKIRIFTWRINEWIDAAQGFLMIFVEFVLFYIAIKLWQRKILTVGDFALIQGYLITLFQQLWDLGRVLRRIYENFADASEMVEILDTPHEIQDSVTAVPLAVPRGEVEFKEVNFSFHQTRKVLHDFNLKIKPGEKVALVGSSGAGKTTVVKLLFRFHDIESGGIFIDGQNIAHVTQDSLRDKIALVPQEPILFHRTLKENIRYGEMQATDEEVRQAAEKANCHDFINQLPYGYDTYVGERGIKLSGGERQRVAMARAILKNAPILVLDEATSSLDSESEALIQDALRKLMQGKTVIVIAHRLSTIMQMDRIIVIDGGKVVAEGRHEELLKEKGIYKKLWEIQAGGFTKDRV